MTPSSATQHRAEKQRLKLLIAALAVTTALLTAVTWQQLGLVLLLTPFVVMVAACAAVFSFDPAEQQARRDAASLHTQRFALAKTHLMPERPSIVLAAGAPVQPLASPRFEEERAEAFARAEAEHGLHFACAHMADGEFLRSFAAGELRAGDFRHGDHLRFAWLTLERMPYDLAEESIVQGLRVFLKRISGGEAQFHATRTHGWTRVLAAQSAPGFLALLQEKGSLLQSDGLLRYWSIDALDSPEARQQRIGTDVAPLPDLAARRQWRTAKRSRLEQFS